MKEINSFLKKIPLVAGILTLLTGLGGIELVNTEGMTAMGYTVKMLFAFVIFAGDSLRRHEDAQI